MSEPKSSVFFGSSYKIGGVDIQQISTADITSNRCEVRNSLVILEFGGISKE